MVLEGSSCKQSCLGESSSTPASLAGRAGAVRFKLPFLEVCVIGYYFAPEVAKGGNFEVSGFKVQGSRFKVSRCFQNTAVSIFLSLDHILTYILTIFCFDHILTISILALFSLSRHGSHDNMLTSMF